MKNLKIRKRIKRKNAKTRRAIQAYWMAKARLWQQSLADKWQEIDALHDAASSYQDRYIEEAYGDPNTRTYWYPDLRQDLNSIDMSIDAVKEEILLLEKQLNEYKRRIACTIERKPF